ncbi:MAG: nucleotidyl transferase AbiEii/AbiGii toxin family protein [Candidatus Aenigmatarchaeota archaeon]
MLYGKFPLKRLLKGRLLQVAELQDKLIIEMCSRFGIVLHGGTVMWRVYGGKRFSFDIDVYWERPQDILEHFKASGAFKLVRSKVTGSGVAYLRFQEGGAVVEVDISPPFRELRPVDGEFYLVDGTSVILRALSPEELLKEKISAFKSRKKARDLYDAFYLLGIARDAGVKNELRGLVPLLKNEPADFAGLRELMLVGKAPEFKTIVRRVKSHAKD